MSEHLDYTFKSFSVNPSQDNFALLLRHMLVHQGRMKSNGFTQADIVTYVITMLDRTK